MYDITGRCSMDGNGLIFSHVKDVQTLIAALKFLRKIIASLYKR